MIQLSGVVLKFLDTYAQSRGWEEKGQVSVCRALCERYIYATSCHQGSLFLTLAAGWIWGRSNDQELGYIESNVETFLLQKYLINTTD